jgi:hypothetical protein
MPRKFEQIEIILDFLNVEKFFDNTLVSFEKININKEDFRKLIKDFAKFLDLFGFVGGKWELGFGKISLKNKVDSCLRLDDFLINEKNKKDKNNKNSNENDENRLFDLNNQNIVVYEKNDIGKEFNKSNLEKFLGRKVKNRNKVRGKDNCFKDLNLKRHYIFGSTQRYNKYPI